MHFWIDKRSQSLGGFNPRHRVPSSLSARGGGGRRWGGPKPIIPPPIHRNVHSDASSSSLHRPPPPYNQYNAHSNYPRESEATPRVHTTSSVLLESPIEPAVQSPPPGKLRYGMWVSLVLVTIFIMGIKFYFDNQVRFLLQGTGLEVVVTGTVLVVLVYLLAGCTLSLCRTKARPLEPSTPPITMLELIPSEAPPPPYHIAVTPPPPYDKSMA